MISGDCNNMIMQSFSASPPDDVSQSLQGIRMIKYPDQDNCTAIL